RLRIVNWAGIDPRKGAHLLVEAVAGSALRDRFEIHFHGKRGERDYMEELERKGAGTRLTFHGAFTDAERSSFAARYDVAVFPFLAFETHGLAVDEALATGIPVVVCDRGAPRERVGSQGIVVPVGDVAALREVLEQLARDPERCRTLRRGAPALTSLEEHSVALLALYASLIV